MKPKIDPAAVTVELVRELLAYDPQTGVFTWRVSRSRQVAGVTAGRVGENGYRRIGIRGGVYLAHRLAWLWTYGSWPEDEIDHINCDRDDNRLANLRLASRSQNEANSRLSSRSSSRLKGAWFHKRAGKWVSGIEHDGRQIHLGTFSSAEEAHAAYCAAARGLFGQYARAE